MAETNGAPGKIIYLGACLIAAVRLAREENWNNSPRVVSRISDAISLAERIYDRMKVDYPHCVEMQGCPFAAQPESFRLFPFHSKLAPDS
ncbi:MAG: hypothetical protein WCG81_01600 [Candidatus Angelobacter sp.]